MTPLTSQLDPQATAVERPIETAKFTPSLGHPRLAPADERPEGHPAAAMTRQIVEG